MFWYEEDEIDVEGLRQRFEGEWQAGRLTYYSQSELKELFEWYMEESRFSAARLLIDHASYLYPDWEQVKWWRSRIAYEEERYLEAYVQGMEAFERMPLTPEVYEHLIEVSLAAGRGEAAEWLFELWWEETESGAARSWGARLLAEGYLFRGEWEKAIPYLWKGWSVASPPRQMTFIQYLVGAYRRSEKLHEGLHAFSQQLWESPLEPTLWLGLARLFLSKFAYNQAAQALHQAASLLESTEEPEDRWMGELHILWALWHEAQGHREEAFRSWLWARHYLPRKAIILSHLVLHYQRLGDLQSARRYVESLYKYGLHSPRIRRQIADFHWEEGSYVRAIFQYRTLIKHEKHRIHALGRLMVSLIKVREFSRLRGVLRYAMRHMARTPQAWLEWVEMAFAAGEHAFALHLLERAFRLKGLVLPAAAFYWHAALLVYQRQYDAALVSLELALLTDSTQVELFHRLTEGLSLPHPFRVLLHRYRYGQLSFA